MLYLIAMVIGIALFALWHRDYRAASLLPVAALAIALVPLTLSGAANTRVARSAETVFDIVKEGNKGQPAANGERRIVDLTNGRVALWKQAASEIMESPIIGTGFSQWGRYSPAPEAVKLNNGTHIYYLTYLWKGGLLFAIPFTLFLAVAAWNAFRERRLTSSPEQAFASLSVALTFGLLAFTYVPNVPSVECWPTSCPEVRCHVRGAGFYWARSCRETRL